MNFFSLIFWLLILQLPEHLNASPAKPNYYRQMLRRALINSHRPPDWLPSKVEQDPIPNFYTSYRKSHKRNHKSSRHKKTARDNYEANNTKIINGHDDDNNTETSINICIFIIFSICYVNNYEDDHNNTKIKNDNNLYDNKKTI